MTPSMALETEEQAASSAAQGRLQQQQVQSQQGQQQQGQEQQVQQQQQHGLVQPYIGWDLTLHPRSLNRAYWRERAPRYAQWDFQVVAFLLLTLLAMTLRFTKQMGVTRVTLSSGLAWLMCIAWAVALYHPFYMPYRIPIVLGGRLLMAITTYLATNGVQEQLCETLMFPSAKLSLVFKVFLFCNTGQMPVESVRLQLPIVWQAVATGGKAVALFLSEFTQEFVAFCNTPRYLQALGELNGFWAAFIQSGSPMTLPVSKRLAGRSAEAVMAITTVWTTLVLLICYLCYISLWSDIRSWLASKARGLEHDESVVIGNTPVTSAQIYRMCGSSFGVLLDARGAIGLCSRALLQLGVINILCMCAWVLSHYLVQQFLPSVLPRMLFGLYFQELPAQDS